MLFFAVFMYIYTYVLFRTLALLSSCYMHSFCNKADWSVFCNERHTIHTCVAKCTISEHKTPLWKKATWQYGCLSILAKSFSVLSLLLWMICLHCCQPTYPLWTAVQRAGSLAVTHRKTATAVNFPSLYMCINGWDGHLRPRQNIHYSPQLASCTPSPSLPSSFINTD